MLSDWIIERILCYINLGNLQLHPLHLVATYNTSCIHSENVPLIARFNDEVETRVLPRKKLETRAVPPFHHHLACLLSVPFVPSILSPPPSRTNSPVSSPCEIEVRLPHFPFTPQIHSHSNRHRHTPCATPIRLDIVIHRVANSPYASKSPKLSEYKPILSISV